jgi:hypothetical protein
MLQKINDINFSEFDRQYTKTELSNYLKATRSGKSRLLTKILFGVFFAMFAAPFIGIFLNLSKGSGGEQAAAKGTGLVSAILFIVISLVLIKLWRNYYYKSKEFSLRLSNLATANNCSFFEYLTPDTVSSSGIFLQQQGAIFGAGSSQSFSTVFGNANFGLASYQYTTGSGKNRTTHRWIVASIKLSKKLPHTLFDNKKNNFFGLSNLPQQFKSNQLLTSEAEFDDTFKVYVPEGFTIDVLSFVTPEFMQLLITDFNEYEIEIVDDSLSIYQTGNWMTKDKFKPLLQRLHRLAQELEGNISTFNASLTDAEIASRTASTRLKQSFLAPTIVIGAASIAIILQLYKLHWSLGAVAALSVLLIGLKIVRKSDQ